jgi:hypothetical protein
LKIKAREMMKERSYIMTNYRVLIPQYEFLDRVLKGLLEPDRVLVMHVLFSVIVQNKESVPIPFVTIRKYLRGANLGAVSDYLDISDYSKVEHRARDYSPKPWLKEPFLAFEEEMGFDDFAKAERVNAFTGRAVRTPPKSRLYDAYGHPYPELPTRSVKTLEANGRDINKALIEANIKRMELAVIEAEERFGKDSKEYKKAVGRLRTDKANYRRVLERQPTVNGDLATYHNAYLVSTTGRIYDSGGGLQSSTKETKQASITGVPDLHNYDLDNSQPTILAQLLDDVGGDARPIREYIERGKGYYAEKAGVDTDVMKRVILALMMGATFPKDLRRLEAGTNSILEVLSDHYGKDKARLKEILEAVRAVTEHIRRAIAEYHDFLINYLRRRKRETRLRAGATIQNAVGMKLRLGDLPLGGRSFETVAKVSAFLLQGQEAAFTHNLTVLSEKYGYIPRANEHDGLLTTYPIPQEAVDEAAELSGLRNPKMVEKPFVKPEKKAA